MGEVAEGLFSPRCERSGNDSQKSETGEMVVSTTLVTLPKRIDQAVAPDENARARNPLEQEQDTPLKVVDAEIVKARLNKKIKGSAENS